MPLFLGYADIDLFNWLIELCRHRLFCEQSMIVEEVQSLE
jgi:hypothetical protein